MTEKPDCYSCKSKVNSFDWMECGELLKEGQHLFIDWWYWNGHKNNEPCPDICPKLKLEKNNGYTD